MKKLEPISDLPANEKKQDSLEDLIKPGDNLEERAQDPKFLEQLAERQRKIVHVSALSPELKKDFQQVVESLLHLRSIVAEKSQSVFEKSSSIKDKVERLLKSGDVQINQQEYKKSEISVLHYVHLLKNITFEIEKEISYFSYFLKDDSPKVIIARTTDSDKFEELAVERMIFTKRYIKTINKDLQVSYSRYCYGFDAQLKRINYIEAVMKHEKKE